MTTDPLPTSAAPVQTLPVRSAGWPALWCLALMIVPLGVILHLIATYAVDIPFWDQWETARLFTAPKDSGVTLWELARQQNESRLLFPNLVFLALSLPGNWNVVREMYFSVALVVTVSAVLFVLLRRTGFSLVVRSVLFFGINWLLFSLTQHENWFFGIQVCYYLPPTALCLAILANVSGWSLRAKTLAALGLSFVAAYSFSGGVLICLLAFPGFLRANWSREGRRWPTVEEWNWHIAYVIGSVVMLTAYFTDYRSPEGEPPIWFAFLHPVEASKYLLAWCGSPLLCRGPLPASMAVGALALLALAGLLVLSRHSLGTPAEQPKLYPWLVLAAYGVGTGLLTTLGRVGFGTLQALSSRYVAFSTYLYVAILVLGAYQWSFHRARLPRPVWRGALALLLGAAVLFGCTDFRTVPWIRSGSQHRKFAAQGLVFLPLMPNSQNLDGLCGAPSLVQRHGPDLVRRHLLTAPLASAPALQNRLRLLTPEGDRHFGVLDEPTPNAEGRVTIRGWAVDPYQKKPAGTVLITCTGADQVTRPLVVLLTNTYRLPGAPATGAYQAMACAFAGGVSFDRLAPGKYLVAAWWVDARLSILNQIGDTYLFTWTPRGTSARTPVAADFPPLNPQEGNRGGSLDEAVLVPGQGVAVRGWAVDPKTGTVPIRVFVTCTDEAGTTTRLLGSVTPANPRDDVARSLHNDTVEYCGFQAQLDPGPLPPGTYRVGAWLLGGPDKATLVQLAGTHPIQVPPPPR